MSRLGKFLKPLILPPIYIICNNQSPKLKPAKALWQLIAKVLGGIAILVICTSTVQRLQASDSLELYYNNIEPFDQGAKATITVGESTKSRLFGVLSSSMFYCGLSVDDKGNRSLAFSLYQDFNAPRDPNNPFKAPFIIQSSGSIQTEKINDQRFKGITLRNKKFNWKLNTPYEFELLLDHYIHFENNTGYDGTQLTLNVTNKKTKSKYFFASVFISGYNPLNFLLSFLEGKNLKNGESHVFFRDVKIKKENKWLNVNSAIYVSSNPDENAIGKYAGGIYPGKGKDNYSFFLSNGNKFQEYKMQERNNFSLISKVNAQKAENVFAKRPEFTPENNEATTSPNSLAFTSTDDEQINLKHDCPDDPEFANYAKMFVQNNQWFLLENDKSLQAGCYYYKPNRIVNVDNQELREIYYYESNDSKIKGYWTTIKK